VIAPRPADSFARVAVFARITITRMRKSHANPQAADNA